MTSSLQSQLVLGPVQSQVETGSDCHLDCHLNPAHIAPTVVEIPRPRHPGRGTALSKAAVLSLGQACIIFITLGLLIYCRPVDAKALATSIPLTATVAVAKASLSISLPMTTGDLATEHQDPAPTPLCMTSGALATSKSTSSTEKGDIEGDTLDSVCKKTTTATSNKMLGDTSTMPSSGTSILSAPSAPSAPSSDPTSGSGLNTTSIIAIVTVVTTIALSINAIGQGGQVTAYLRRQNIVQMERLRVELRIAEERLRSHSLGHAARTVSSGDSSSLV
ncbi:hypothetical protein FRB96_007423 [Tulasnella sp. 330]|nr:hypothetical protein FRB96_007423 [Tulasnella sp. 330]